MTLTPTAERLAVELSLPFYDLGLSRREFELPTFRLRNERFNRLRHRRGWRELKLSPDPIYLVLTSLIGQKNTAFAVSRIKIESIAISIN